MSHILSVVFLFGLGMNNTLLVDCRHVHILPERLVILFSGVKVRQSQVIALWNKTKEASGS